MADASKLCDDHANGWTVRYSGRKPPRFGCPECLAIYEGRAPQGANLEIKNFSKLEESDKARILLGQERYSVVMYDIEATHLKPNVGRIICCSFKPLGGEVKTFHALQGKFKVRDVYDDSKLAVAIRDELEAYDIIVGWNSKQFDTKYVNSRLFRMGHRIKPAQYHVDGMWSWRSKFNAWSGLDNAQKFALPDAETTKTSIAWPQWMRVIGWDRELRNQAMAEITDHCERDVTVLEDVYRAMVEANVIRSIRKDGGVL